jgi:hypothetical protein
MFLPEETVFHFFSYLNAKSYFQIQNAMGWSLQNKTTLLKSKSGAAWYLDYQHWDYSTFHWDRRAEKKYPERRVAESFTVTRLRTIFLSDRILFLEIDFLEPKV